MKWMVQGKNGPEPARRPPQAVMDKLNEMDPWPGAVPSRQAFVKWLCDQGYVMQMNIDGWGWDEDAVVSQWKMWGYTWVPPANWPPIEMAPGLVAPGLTQYDPNPPLGAILVPE
jgi:hypothetical protein